jgi:hypothetical protein
MIVELDKPHRISLQSYKRINIPDNTLSRTSYGFKFANFSEDANI